MECTAITNDFDTAANSDRLLSYHTPPRARPGEIFAAAIVGIVIGIAVGAFCGSFLLILLELAVNFLQLSVGSTAVLLTVEATLAGTSILGAVIGSVLFTRSVAEAPSCQCNPTDGGEEPSE